MTELTTKDQLQYSEEQLKRLYDWLMDDKRKPAKTFFTQGMLRTVANEIEFKLKSCKN